MRKWLPLLTICSGTFMLLIDVTIVNVALPDMAADLGASFGALQWVVNGYAVAMAALLLGVGAIADLAGHRRIYLSGLALFAISSLVCGISPNSTVLVAARVVQGIGAAAMAATTFPMLNSAYDGPDRGTAYGLWGAIAGASSAIGPIVGGVLTEAAGWRWIFFVNLPVSVAVIVLGLWVLADRDEKQSGRLDLAGMAGFAIAAGAATYALIRANEHGWSEAGTWSMLGVAAAALVAFVLVERRATQPLFDLALLRQRSFAGVLIAGAALFFSAFAVLMYTSIWLQSELGMSPIQTGLIGLPLSAMAFGVSAGFGRHLHGPNAGRIIGGGLFVIGAGGVLGTALVHGDAGWPALLPGFVVIGTGVGLATATLGSATMSAVEPRRGGMATGAVNTAQQLGMAFGIAALGGVFTVRAQNVLADNAIPDADEAARVIAGGRSGLLLAQAPDSARPALAEAARLAAVAGLQGALAVAGVVGLLGGLLAVLLIKPQPSAGTRTPANESEEAIA
ncbi:MFS transporter [Nocardia huaxiensis]|uniref:MFS transporter n=1 Tax=Nocardia huaxiensis TaxID=2755382 RepID=UPI001E3C5B8D|nr:MFS transporter [Nocardia huaxiensis]UFS93175.1 MFS transporter [Nocardia huaxiensis]